MSSPRAVLFDVDGTLVDSTYVHTVAWWQAFRRHDVDVAMWRIHRAIGMGADQLVPHVSDAELDSGALGRNPRRALLGLLAVAAGVARGARAGAPLPRRRAGDGVRVLGWGREVQVLRRLLDIDDAIDHATSADDAETSKPAPDLVQVALGKAGVDAQDAVFVGDAVWDVHACRDAGVVCIGLACGGTAAGELREAGAAAVYRDPSDVLGHWHDSPLVARTST